MFAEHRTTKKVDFITIIAISLGLSVDSFAVSVSSALMIPHIKFRQACKIAFFLAFFQAVMPILGWFIGFQFLILIKDFDHWIAFGLLCFLGFRMIIHIFMKDKERKFNPLNMAVLVSMSLATSMDALAVGFSFALIKIPILWAVIIIGVVTFLITMLGMLLGKQVSHKASHFFEILGGLILIGIGFKILMEHLG